MFLEMGVRGLPALVHHVKHLCNAIKDERKISLLLRENTLMDCLAQAKHSVSFHQIEMHELSHYKEIAHIGYWIAKLKPISIASPLTTSYLVNAVADYYNQLYTISGGTVTLLRMRDEEADSSYKRSIGFSVNEHVAMSLIWNVCETHWEGKLARLKGEQRDIRESQLTQLRELFFAELHPELRTSLRLHSFTPRAFATTIECLFRYDLSPSLDYVRS